METHEEGRGFGQEAGLGPEPQAQASSCALSAGATLPVGGSGGSSFGVSRLEGTLITKSTSRSSEQRHVKAEPLSNPVWSAHEPRWRAAVTCHRRGNPSAEGVHHVVLISISTHPQHLSCSFFTFSHIQATGQLFLALLQANLGTHWLRRGLLQA